MKILPCAIVAVLNGIVIKRLLRRARKRKKSVMETFRSSINSGKHSPNDRCKSRIFILRFSS